MMLSQKSRLYLSKRDKCLIIVIKTLNYLKAVKLYNE